MKLLGWFFFFFLGGSEFVAWVSHCILLWVPLMVGLGVWTALLLGFCRRYEKKKRLCLLQRCFKPTMFLKKWRGWEEERGREKVVFLLFCWCVGSGLAGIKHNFYTSSWPNLISCNKHPNLSLCLLIICSVLRKRDIVEIIDNLVLTI